MNLEAYLSDVRALMDRRPESAVLTATVVQGPVTLARPSIGVPLVLVPTKPLNARFTIAERTVSHTLRHGDIAVLPADLPLAFEFGPIEAVAMAMSPAALDVTAVALESRPGAVRLRPVECARDVLLAALAEELSREQSGPATQRPYYADSLATSILSRVVSQYAAIDFAGSPAMTRSGDERILRARAFIDENLAGDLSLLAVARHAGLSRPHLTELFRAATGLTIWQYVKRRRLLRARHILETSDAKIADIALQLGYLSVSHFSQSFRVAFGIGPGGHRRRMTEHPREIGELEVDRHRQ